MTSTESCFVLFRPFTSGMCKNHLCNSAGLLVTWCCNFSSDLTFLDQAECQDVSIFWRTLLKVVKYAKFNKQPLSCVKFQFVMLQSQAHQTVLVLCMLVGISNLWVWNFYFRGFVCVVWSIYVVQFGRVYRSVWSSVFLSAVGTYTMACFRSICHWSLVLLVHHIQSLWLSLVVLFPPLTIPYTCPCAPPSSLPLQVTLLVPDSYLQYLFVCFVALLETKTCPCPCPSRFPLPLTTFTLTINICPYLCLTFAPYPLILVPVPYP